MSGNTCNLTKEDAVRSDCDRYNTIRGHLNDVDGVECERCMNRGDFMVPFASSSGAVALLKPCTCMGTRKTIRRFLSSGISPDIIKSYTFDGYIADEPWQQQVKDAAISFSQDPSARLFYAGGASGSGKSHICTALAAHFINAGREARYVRWREDVTRLKSIIMDAEAYGNAMWELKNIDILYIDDYFKPIRGRDGKVAPPTEADIGLSYELFDYRYSTNRKGITIISSERHLSEIMAIDEATGGRIAEMATPRYMCNIRRDPQRNYRLRGMKTI